MRKFFFLSVALLINNSANAQFQEEMERFQFDSEINYDSSIPKPSEFLGYEPGQEYTFTHEVMEYFEELANSSDGITFHEYGRTIDWNQRHAPKALAKLRDHGYKVRSSLKSFTKDGVEYSRGSLMVLMGRNHHKSSSIHADMSTIAEEAQEKITGFNTGRMDEGSDLVFN